MNNFLTNDVEAQQHQAIHTTIKQVFKNCAGDMQPSNAAPNKDCGCGCNKQQNWMQKCNFKHVLIAAVVVAGLVVLFSSESK
jgi:hypothetical protein